MSETQDDASAGAIDVDTEAMLALLGSASAERAHWAPADHAKEEKAQGDRCFRKQQWDKALEFYTRALSHTPDDEKLLSNRSAAYVEVKKYQDALADAVRCREVAPDWPKSFFRKGVALRCLRRFDMAISEFSEGLARDPSNPAWQKEIAVAEDAKAARAAARR